jgi:predicted alpha/beta hydrolase family esterase
MRTSDADLLIIPGLGGSGRDHWQTRWEQKLSTARRAEQRDWNTAIHAARDSALRIRGAFLVAAPSEERLAGVAEADPAFRPFPRQKLPFPSLLVASRADPYSDFGQSEALALDWGAELIDAGASGHINAESGHGPWPEGLLQFAAFMKRL